MNIPRLILTIRDSRHSKMDSVEVKGLSEAVNLPISRWTIEADVNDGKSLVVRIPMEFVFIDDRSGRVMAVEE